RYRNDRREYALNGALGGIRRRELRMRFHHLLDRLDHDDGVIDDDADRQNHRKQRNGVCRIPDRVENDEGSDQADRNRHHWDERGADITEKNENHEQHKNRRLNKRVLDGCDRGGEEGGGGVGGFQGGGGGERIRTC